MNLELYLAFVLATAILIAMPGPNVSLIVAHAVAHGTRTALATVLGTQCAQAIQLGLRRCAGDEEGEERRAGAREYRGLHRAFSRWLRSSRAGV